MPMKRDDHENLLAELLKPDLDASTKTDILQQLRNDYIGVHTEFEEINKSAERLKSDNDALIVSNSKLFREAGIVKEDKPDPKEIEKEYSETVTLEALEK